MGKAVKKIVTRLGLAVLVVLAAYAGWKLRRRGLPASGDGSWGSARSEETAVPEAVDARSSDARRPRNTAREEDRDVSGQSEDAVELRLRAVRGVLPPAVLP